LRVNESIGIKGNVRGERPAQDNKYNQNFRNRFCACGQDYDPHKERGTMFQCLGLGSVEDGGCGEDWYHPDCIMGLSRDWRKSIVRENKSGSDTPLQPIQEENLPLTTTNGEVHPNHSVAGAEAADIDYDVAPPGFPSEDDFEYFICFKCVEAFPWIKRYAGTKGFLMPVYHKPTGSTTAANNSLPGVESNTDSRKRKATLNQEDASEDQPAKRHRSVDAHVGSDTAVSTEQKPVSETTSCSYSTLPPARTGTFSLFLTEDFRGYICHCPEHFPIVSRHICLLEEEDTYEPPVSESSEAPGGSVGSRSLLDRGEAALSNVDRVRAIEGVMVYNDLKEKVKAFLKPFAESGKPVSSEEIKAYFEKLRGDDEAIRIAAMRGKAGSGDGGDNRREQSGY
jgi:E3 ubiquitin-protein ligase UBR7